MPTNKRPDFDVKQLTQMQWYLGTEMVEDYLDGHLSRRSMLKRVLYITGSSAAAAALLSACGVPAAAPTAAPAPTAAQPNTAVPPGPPVSPAKNPVLGVAATDPAVEGNAVSYDTDIKVSAYLARPKAAGSYPGIVVIHENRGLTDHIRDVARRLAKAGFIAVAPDLVSRGGGTDTVGPDKVPGWLGNAKEEDLVKDMNGAVDFLEKQPGLLAGKLGVMGFCYGGGQTIQLAAANSKIKAAVPYYGPVPSAPLKPIEGTNAAIFAVYGALDNRVNGTAPALEEAMKKAGKPFDKKQYADANHAFNNDTGGSYNEAAAVAAWADTLAWFNKYLKG